MQMQSVATKAGVAICWAPSRIARITGFPIARLRFVFSISTGRVVDQDADRERAARRASSR